MMTSFSAQWEDSPPVSLPASLTHDPILDLEVILGLIGTARSMVTADLSKLEKGTPQFSLGMEALDFLGSANRDAYDTGTIRPECQEAIEAFIHLRDYSLFPRRTA